jgi:hypothetical protein
MAAPAGKRCWTSRGERTQAERWSGPAFFWSQAKTPWVACWSLAKRLVQPTKQAQVSSRKPSQKITREPNTPMVTQVSAKQSAPCALCLPVPARLAPTAISLSSSDVGCSLLANSNCPPPQIDFIGVWLLLEKATVQNLSCIYISLIWFGHLLGVVGCKSKIVIK